MRTRASTFEKKAALMTTTSKKTTVRKAAAKKTTRKKQAATETAAKKTAVAAETKVPAKKKAAARKKAPARKKAAAKKKAPARKKAAAATPPAENPEGVEPEVLPAAEAPPPVVEFADTEPIRTPGRITAHSIRVAARRLGIDELFPQQKQVIDAVTKGRDVLMVVPTGSGKSACYQVPSMLLAKPVVVASPLRALLQDQAVKLEKLGVPCIRLDGTLRGKLRAAALQRIQRGGSLLVMTTPETMENVEVRGALKKGGVSVVAVDEAHCLSEWGHDFRPAYLRLGARVRELGSPSVLALTATATPRVRTTIVNSLRMTDPEVVATSPHRSNLAFEVLRCEGDARARALVRLVLRLRRPGIIYCATRREVDFVFALLQRFQVPGRRYHGGMTALERNAAQDHFMRRGQRSVMVATNAFGLGIDKPDIRYVLHYQQPASLEQYVQEAGRGGRDGKKSNCILLYDPADREIHEALLARSRVRPDQLYKLGSALAAWAEEGRSPTLEALALSAELGPRIASALLAKIEEAGIVTIHDHEIEMNEPAESIEQDTRSLAGQFETLRTQDGRRMDALAEYSDPLKCRATFLQEYFGEEAEADCGLCDICIGGRSRPTGFFAPLSAPDPKPSRKKSQDKRGRGRNRNRRNGRRSAGSNGGAADGNSDQQRAEGGAEPRNAGRRRSRRRRNGRGNARPGDEGRNPQRSGDGARAEGQGNQGQRADAGNRERGENNERRNDQQRPSRRRRGRRGRGGQRRPQSGTSDSPAPRDPAPSGDSS